MAQKSYLNPVRTLSVLTIIGLVVSNGVGGDLTSGFKRTAALQAKRRGAADVSDVSPQLIRNELAARMDLATHSAIADALVVYTFSVGNGRNFNPNEEEIAHAIERLNSEIATTGLFSHVAVRTTTPGARVYYCLTGRLAPQSFNRLTNKTANDIPVGLYHIWAERAGTTTSSKTAVFRIIEKDVTVDLEERKDLIK